MAYYGALNTYLIMMLSYLLRTIERPTNAWVVACAILSTSVVIAGVMRFIFRGVVDMLHT